jgi:DNA-binding transcriptional LysR family regulator
MELRQLRYFVRIVELGSMSRAAWIWTWCSRR